MACTPELDELKSEFKDAQDTNEALKNGIEDASATLYDLEQALEQI